MQGETWVRADLWLGDRLKTFVVPAREGQALGLDAAFLKLVQADPAAAARHAAALVEQARPALQGVQVVGIGLPLARMRWELLCLHPAFPQQLVPEPERLTTCPGCGKGLPLPDGAGPLRLGHLTYDPAADRAVEWCSEACATANDADAPQVR